MAKSIKDVSETTTNRKKQYFNLEEEKAFFDEVDEEVRNDRFKKLINKYGGFILCVLILALSFAVGYEKFGEWRIKKAEEKNVVYAQALVPQKNFEDNIAELENIVATESGLYKDMARLQIINLLLDNNQTERAITNMTALVNDVEANAKIREIATIKLATYQIDTADYATIKALLEPILQNNNSSWRPMAKELMAMAAIQAKHFEEAKSIYQELLTHSSISDDFKARINDMLASISDAVNEAK
jgi:hypothetical protein